MGSEELAANLFRITQTEAKMQREQPRRLTPASVSIAVGSAVRETISSLGGTMPEDLPTTDKGISELEHAQIKRLRIENEIDSGQPSPER